MKIGLIIQILLRIAVVAAAILGAINIFITNNVEIPLLFLILAVVCSIWAEVVEGKK